jgi:hypothetical protein
MQNSAVVAAACRFLPAARAARAARGRFPPTAGATPARRKTTPLGGGGHLPLQRTISSASRSAFHDRGQLAALFATSDPRS